MRGTVAAVAGYPTTNRVWYRTPATPFAADVQRMTADVAASFRELALRVMCTDREATCAAMPLLSSCPAAASSPAFIATAVSVFTWFAVGRYNAGNDLLDTFQAVLASGGRSGIRYCAPLLLVQAMPVMLSSHYLADASGVSYVTFCYDNLLYDSGSGEQRR